MYSLLRPLLFQLEAEKAHAFTLSALNYLPSCLFKKPKGRPVKAMGLEFSHPVGLAAGLDKNGAHLEALSKIGFSFIELGTVTPKPQMGNPKPRLFRLQEDNALINRMGFNNQGVAHLIENLNKACFNGLLGINIGKNKDTPLDKAAEDYLACMRQVYEKASYITINISSPNTPDLRLLQQKEYLNDLLAQLHQEQKKLADFYQRHVPLVVKVSPDESDEQLKTMTEAILSHHVEGLIATNTTCSRPELKDSNRSEAGGLSGRPLAALSTQCLRLLKSYVGNEVTLIGVGGIDSVESASEKMQAGATLIQLYTGLIYKGPGLVSKLVAGL